ncbi:MAG: putative selenate reductase subunit YgfK [Candidatus Marinimicrobia bacterium]|nr:putative selenate reductase subunit YgfK [Candidatus Neomarinimicrobiota bacterium]
MSDNLYPIPIDRLLKWILAKEQQGQIFGISKDLFFMPKQSDPFRMMRYGQLLETPIGVAAGPHTQLSINIITAWLIGARYIELKTVQTLDEIEVAKPCIDMQDEGYNCEWSQELKLRQSFDQYLDAWILIHILRHKFGWHDTTALGLIFNMSVGYDLAGIKQTNIQEFLDLMENCQPLLDDKIDLLVSVYPAIKDIAISARMSDNVTLSTMHGCPPDEIEKIGRYLIEERNLHTLIKLNPTLLGPERLRQILNEKLGFKNIQVPDQAFEHDLKYDQALEIIDNLQLSAKRQGVEFGLKLTNTLEVLNLKDLFPKQEKQAYLSGRALHPLSVNLAARLQEDYGGRLDLSFCAGVDCFNIAALVACGLSPVTTCSDILKPGGYGRLKQYLDNLRVDFEAMNAFDTEQLIMNSASSALDLNQAKLENLNRYADQVVSAVEYQRPMPFYPSIKTGRKLEQFDCISAPCVEACATDQNIPDYMYYTARGEFDKAYKVITATNPLPGITGQVCDHLCQLKCTRINYDRPLMIREIKRYVTENHAAANPSGKGASLDVKIAVVGGGPSGLSCAYFLAREGFKVDLFEAKDQLGGMVSGAIPRFRLGTETIAADLKLITDLGVRINYNTVIDEERFRKLQSDYDYIYLGVGAQSSRKLDIDGEDEDHVRDPLEFLAGVKQRNMLPTAADVLIIGGGNTAMDAARTVLRQVGSDGRVSIIYRRTIDKMPADWVEIAAAQAEGISISELIAPLKIKRGKQGLILTCCRMKLGDKDSSGRPRPVMLPETEFELTADYIIPAVGQIVTVDFISPKELKIDPKTQATSLPNIYAGGDAIRGAYTIITAVGDGRRAAKNIIRAARNSNSQPPVYRSFKDDADNMHLRLAQRDFGSAADGFTVLHTKPVKSLITPEQAQVEAARCLFCDEFCDICVTVCPNRANIAYPVDKIDLAIPVAVRSKGQTDIQYAGKFKIDQPTQIFNLADLCNECGNCTVFCPTSGRPFMDKPRLCLSDSSYNDEPEGYRFTAAGLKYKLNTSEATLIFEADGYVYETVLLTARLNGDTLAVEQIHWKDNRTNRVSLKQALIMIILWKSIRNLPQFHV